MFKGEHLCLKMADDQSLHFFFTATLYRGSDPKMSLPLVRPGPEVQTDPRTKANS